MNKIKQFSEAVTTNNVANMMGSFSILTDHPGIDPKGNIKKKKTTKVNRSPFMNNKDAKKQHIKGTISTSGLPIINKIDKRLANG